jgi:hypothetical protein
MYTVVGRKKLPPFLAYSTPLAVTAVGGEKGENREYLNVEDQAFSPPYG